MAEALNQELLEALAESLADLVVEKVIQRLDNGPPPQSNGQHAPDFGNQRPVHHITEEEAAARYRTEFLIPMQLTGINQQATPDLSGLDVIPISQMGRPL